MEHRSEFTEATEEALVLLCTLNIVLMPLKNKEKKDRGNQIKLLTSYLHSTTSRPTEVKSI